MSHNPRHPHVVHLAEVEPVERVRGRFSFKRRLLGAATGARGLGCSHIELEPGQAAFPFHYHCSNEESLFVLEGTGILRFGNERIDLEPGDYATFPIGPDAAHQLTATGTTPLRYLCISTLQHPEVVGYPDSNKVGVIAHPPGTNGTRPWIAKWFRGDDNVDYFDGEET